jgi:hypothetical protein
VRVRARVCVRARVPANRSYEIGCIHHATRGQLNAVFHNSDRFCGPVVRVSGYKSSGPGLIPGATRFSEN